MQKRLIPVLMLVAGLGSSPALAQDYPNRVVRILTSAAGGGGDALARLLAQGLARTLGQSVIVENRGISGADAVAKAQPDGHTLLFYGSNVWISPLMQETSWDPVRDFSPITLAAEAVNILVVHPLVPAKSAAELIALAKAKPGEINFGSSAPGSSTHLAGELFKAMAGINIVNVPYKGVANAYTDLMAGRIQMMIGASGSLGPLVKSGKLRILGVGNEMPSALFPGVPPVAAALPGYEAGVPFAMFAPAKTPVVIVNRLHEGSVRILRSADSRDSLAKMEVEVIASTPAQLAEKLNSDMSKLGKIIKAAGIGK